MFDDLTSDDMASHSSPVLSPVPHAGLPPVAASSHPVESHGTSQRDVSERVRQRLDDLETLARQLNEEDAYSQPPADVPKDICLSVVVPVFNEVETIRKTIARLLAVDVSKEIIIVDDCSTDGTFDVVAELAELPDIRLIAKASNAGKGAAVRTGIERAQGDVIMVQDADLEYDPRDIPRLLQPIVAGRADVVYGSRFLEDRTEGSSSLHRFGNQLLTRLSNLTTGLGLTDMETCYKVFRREAIQELAIRQNRFGFEPEITAKIARRGLRVVEVPIRYSARDWDEGKKIGVRDGFNAIYCIFRYAWAD